MTLTNLQTSTGKFTIAAFDHRGSMIKLLGLNENNSQQLDQQMIELKQLFLEVLGPEASAILTDPIWGVKTLGRQGFSTARHPGLDPGSSLDSRFRGNDILPGILLSLEESGYEGGKAVVPKLVDNWGINQIKGYDAAAKLLLYFHPHETQARGKLDLVIDLYTQAKKSEVPFLLEIVLYQLDSESDEDFHTHWADYQFESVELFDGMCDVLKLEYPGLHAVSESEASEQCHKINQSASVPWVVLSQGMEYSKFKSALQTSMKAGASGFAVGRAVWQEIEQFSLNNTSNWELTKSEVEKFLRSTGVDRFRELAGIVG